MPRRPAARCSTPRCPHLKPCPVHRAPRAPGQHRRSTSERGYGSKHQAASKACIEAQPWCSWCGAYEDLVADHIVPGQPEDGYQTLCRSCNTRRRNGATPPPGCV